MVLLPGLLSNQSLYSPQKERDLELAARIGQSLLKKNKTLSERNEFLEEQVEHIREEVRGDSFEVGQGGRSVGNLVWV